MVSENTHCGRGHQELWICAVKWSDALHVRGQQAALCTCTLITQLEVVVFAAVSRTAAHLTVENKEQYAQFRIIHGHVNAGRRNEVSSHCVNHGGAVCDI